MPKTRFFGCIAGGPAAAEVPDLEALTGALIAKKKAYVAHFDELQACYLAMCRDRGAPSATHDSASLDTPSRTSGSSRLADFCGKLNMATQVRSELVFVFVFLFGFVPGGVLFFFFGFFFLRRL